MDPGLKVLNAAEMRKCDRHTMQTEPVSPADLMERASWRLFDAISKELDKRDRIHVVSGPGNNGGDGVCLARYFRSFGYQVRLTVLLFGKDPSEEMARQLQIAATGHFLIPEIAQKPDDLKISSDEVLIDAIFGTGLQTTPEGPWAAAIAKLNNSGSRILSVDMPSGLPDSQSKGVGCAVSADRVYTIQCPKPSLLFPENRIDFETVDAGIDLSEGSPAALYLDPNSQVVRRQIAEWLPHRPKHSHKGHYGHSLLIGGNSGMHGAIALAARACYQSGSGLTTVWSPAETAPWMATLPGVMYHAAPLEPYALPDGFPGKFSAVGIGPGMGTSHAVHDLLDMVLRTAQKPLILDADALNVMAAHPLLLKMVPAGSLLTPHPGELQRLFGDLGQGPAFVSALAEKAKETGLFILAKNTYSLLACPDGTLFYNGTGSPNLARGGSGDTLTGMLTGLYAQTGDMRRAAVCGMYYFGKGITSPHEPMPV